VTAHPVLVRGTIQPPDPDLRLTVNGRAALQIQGGEWATLVETPAGSRLLTADARRHGRLVSRAEVRVTVVGPVTEVRPLDETANVWAPTRMPRAIGYGTPGYTEQFEIDPAGPVKEGRLDPDGTGRAIRSLRQGERYGHVYEAPGVYRPLLRFTDPRGHPSVQQALVLVVDHAWIESVLQQFWARFLAAGRRNDRDELLSLMYYPKRDELRLAYEMMGPGPELLAGWVNSLGDGSLRLKRVSGWGAWCVTRSEGLDSDLFFEMDPSGGQWQWNMR
jgi:hypothetical protein